MITLFLLSFLEIPYNRFSGRETKVYLIASDFFSVKGLDNTQN